MNETPTCRKCGGTRFYREWDEIKCTNCHKEYEPMEKVRDRVGYYQTSQKWGIDRVSLGHFIPLTEFRDEIVLAVKKLGRKEAAETWGVSPATLYRAFPELVVGRKRSQKPQKEATAFNKDGKLLAAEERETIADKAPEAEEPITITGTFIPHGSNGEVPLPQFSNDWAPEVQIKWLDIWKEIHLEKAKVSS